MYTTINVFVWGLITTGIALLFVGAGRGSEWIIQTYLILIQLYLLGVSAFFVFKYLRVSNVGNSRESIKLLKKSDYEAGLVAHGLILGLISIVLIQLNGKLQSFNTIVLILALFYYLVQVVLNARPMLHIGNRSIGYDDYFIEEWEWENLEGIEYNQAGLKIFNETKTFDLDFELINEIDDEHLSEELDRNVLDGEFTKINSSDDLIKKLTSYARSYNLNIVNTEKVSQ